VRPVNLLPEHLRPRERSGRSGTKAYAVLTGLGVLLVAVVVYVVFTNQMTTRQAETERLRAKTAAAEARAGSLASFGMFKETAATRLTSVQSIAAVRFDWERMSRELALVLPKGVWVNELKAQGPGGDASGSASSSSASSGSGTSSPGPSGAGASGPALDLTGCAPSQEAVAETMVRLRRVHQAEDVKLISSTRTDEEGSGGGAPAPAAGASSGGTSAAGGAACGKTGKRTNYAFTIDVVLGSLPVEAPEGGRVPAVLGGGA